MAQIQLWVPMLVFLLPLTFEIPIPLTVTRQLLQSWGAHHTYNKWIQVAEMVAFSANRTNCAVCTLAPVDALGGMPLLPVPWNESLVTTPLVAFQPLGNHSSLWNHSVPFQVHRITGCLCVNKSNDASDSQTYVGTSHCDRTFPAPTNMFESETGTFSGSNLTTCLARLLRGTISAHGQDVYWVCGRKAYHALPRGWYGVCFPAYLIPPMWIPDQIASAPRRRRRSADLATLAGGSSQNWGKNQWPPERILAHYAPASWNRREKISGARGPIYNLNRVIRLQAVVEIVANTTATALRLIATQLDETRNAFLSVRLALDFLLAQHGGFCAALNLTGGACCFNISDHGEAIRNLAAGLETVAHIPTQTWEGWDMSWLDWLPNLGWVKGLFLLLLGPLFILLIFCFSVPC
uniref:Endogenous retrovirus group 3 member 1 Env polyprotein-like n=1 Tax=Podarcis muralis TaxID=64176 RepID=A0A670JX36_PODMU|nr:endogenous retrovirus group 3 member 1 Env polyprotein-like [Podarcis muralis]